MRLHTSHTHTTLCKELLMMDDDTCVGDDEKRDEMMCRGIYMVKFAYGSFKAYLI